MQGLKKIVENSSFEFIIFLIYLTSKDIKPFNVECVTFAYIHALFLFSPSACSLLCSSFYLSGAVIPENTLLVPVP